MWHLWLLLIKMYVVYVLVCNMILQIYVILLSRNLFFPVQRISSFHRIFPCYISIPGRKRKKQKSLNLNQWGKKKKKDTEESTASQQNADFWEALSVYLYSYNHSMMCKDVWILGASCLLKNLKKAVWKLVEWWVSMVQSYYLVNKMSKFNLNIRKKITSIFYSVSFRSSI